MPEINHRLAAAVRQRMLELGWSQTIVASQGGPSTTSLTKITSGEGTVSPKTLAQLDTSLRWRSGTAAALLSGVEPLQPVDLSEVSDDELLAEVRTRMARPAVEPPVSLHTVTAPIAARTYYSRGRALRRQFDAEAEADQVDPEGPGGGNQDVGE